jgi:hypothetical protein
VGGQVVGFEAKGETVADLVVGASARDERQAGAYLGFVEIVEEGAAANTVMAEHQLTEGRPALAAVKWELQAEEDVVFARAGVESGTRGAVYGACKRRGTVRLDLGVAEEFAGVHNEADVVGEIDVEGRVPSVELGPVSGIEKTGLGEGVSGEEFEARELRAGLVDYGDGGGLLR